MCSSSECRVEVLPDGQIDEFHVFTEDEMKALQKSINRLSWKLEFIRTYGVEPREVVCGG